MHIKKYDIEGLFLIEHNNFSDNRGIFDKFYSSSTFDKYIKNKKIRQINFSKTAKKNTIRGMHYQKTPHAEFKIIKCVKGKVYDVVVDIRKNSKTFLKHQPILLNAEKNNILIIPSKCAHGYQALTNNCELLYMHTAEYFAHLSVGLFHKDPLLNIKWPFNGINLSDHDKKWPLINEKFKGI